MGNTGVVASCASAGAVAFGVERAADFVGPRADAFAVAAGSFAPGTPFVRAADSLVRSPPSGDSYYGVATEVGCINWASKIATPPRACVLARLA